MAPIRSANPLASTWRWRISILCCTGCGHEGLLLETDEQPGHEILTGWVKCPNCAVRFAITRGVLRAVENDAYVHSFSFEWQLHRKTQLDSEKNDKSARVFSRKTDLATADLADKQILDVGVGTGRFADVVSRAGGNVVGIDLSFAVETAMDNVGNRSNVNIVQADLFNLPFAD